MKNLLIRLFSILLYAIYLVLGNRIGIAISFNVYRTIDSKVGPLIHESPVLFVVVFILLLLLSILLSVYLVYKSDVLHLELFLVKQFVKKSLLLLLAGFSFGFAYWNLIVIVGIVLLLWKGIL